MLKVTLIHLSKAPHKISLDKLHKKGLLEFFVQFAIHYTGIGLLTPESNLEYAKKVLITASFKMVLLERGTYEK